MNFTLDPVPESQKSVLRQLFQLYAYDFSEYTGSDVNECGLYGDPWLDSYWNEPARHAFFIRAVTGPGGPIAGFVLINDYCHIESEKEGRRGLAEFFVLRKYRRRGAGRQAALAAFSRFPGKWEVCQLVENEASLVFWDRIVNEVSGGSCETRFYQDEGLEYRALLFDNSAAAHAPAISLRPVDSKNYWTACSLDVQPVQRNFVAPNGHSLAQARFDDKLEGAKPRLICADGEPVGFAMTATDRTDGTFWIMRYMIDRRWQGRGYGREAFRQLLALCREEAGEKPIYLDVEPENTAARKLYESFGFVPTGGSTEYGELILRLD